MRLNSCDSAMYIHRGGTNWFSNEINEMYGKMTDCSVSKNHGENVEICNLLNG